MNWFYLTILSVLIVSFANILQRVLMKGDKSNPYSYAFVFHFLIAFLNLIFALIYGSKLSLDGINIQLLLLSSVLWAICSILFFKALQLVEISEITILSSVRVIVTFIASTTFLQETFNIQKVLGTAAILFSTYLVSHSKKGFKLNKGAIYVLLAAIISGLAFITDSVIVKQMEPISYNATSNLLVGLMILIIYPKALTQLNHFIQPNFLFKMIPLGIFSTLQGVTYLIALTNTGVTAQVGIIRQSTVILTVLMAALFLNERTNILKKVFAAILVTFGVILLS